jgi:hypothetical protein
MLFLKIPQRDFGMRWKQYDDKKIFIKHNFSAPKFYGNIVTCDDLTRINFKCLQAFMEIFTTFPLQFLGGRDNEKT